MNVNAHPATNVYSRLLLPVIISAGAVGLSIGLIIPLTSIVLEQRGISVVAIGFNATMFSAAVLLTGPFLPYVMQRMGLLNVMIVGALCSGVFVLGLCIDESLWYWYVLRFLMGVTGGMHWVSSEAWINVMVPEQSRGRVVGAYATVWTMGIAAGPVLLKFIGVDGALPFVISASIMGAAALPLLTVPQVENRGVPPVRHKVLQMAYMSPVATCAGFISGFLETAVLSLLPIYGMRSGIDTASALILVSLFAVGSFVCQPFVGWIADKVVFKTVAILVAAVSILVVPLVHVSLHMPLLTGVLLFVWGGAVGAYYTLGMLKIGQVFKTADLTAASSMFVMAYTFGMVVGPLLGSVSMQISGPAGLLTVLGAVPLVVGVLLVRR